MMGEKIQILYIDNDAGDRALVKDSLEKEHGGFTLTLAKSKEEFETLIHENTYDLVMTDFNILGYEGFQVLTTVKSISPTTPVIIVTGTGSEEIAVKALKMGAADYIIKSPQHIKRLPNTINVTLEKNRLLKERESDREKLLKMNRVYSLISQINQLIVRTQDRDELLHEACNIAITFGKFQMAWIGFAKDHKDLITPYCWAGHEDGYLSSVNINQNTGVTDGRGPTRSAFKKGNYFICNDIEHDPIFTPWKEEALKRDYRSSISLPLKQGGKTTGTFNVYASEPYFFDEQEINAFIEVVRDLSFALDTIQNEKIRRKNEKELQAYFEHDIAADFLVTADGKLINCNKTFHKIFGIESEAQKKQFNITQLYKNPEERKELLALVKKNGKVENYEIELIRKNGKPLSILGNILGNFDEKGKLVSLREYVVDITQRKLAEKELMKTNRLFALISQVNQMIVRTTDIETLFQESCKVAIDFGKFRMAWIGLIDENSNFLKPYCWSGYEEKYFTVAARIKRDIDSPEGRGPANRALQESKYIVCNDIEHDPDFEPWRKEALKRNYRSSIALPIKLEGNVIGTYNIYADEVHFFDSEEIKLLEEVVGDISFALEGIKAEEKRRENEKELHAYFEHDISADFLVTTEGKLINCNKTFYKMFGIKSEVQKEKFNITDLYKNPNDRKVLLAEVKKNGKVIDHEINLVKSDGTSLYVLANIQGNFDEDGELVSLREYTVDITQRKLAEESSAKLSRAVEQSPETIIITDKDGNIEYVNPTFTKVTGYTFQEVAGKNPSILSSHEKSEKEYKKLWNTILSGKVWRGEFRDRKKSGELYWEQASISPIFNEKGEITHFVAVKEDITERKAKDLELNMALEKAKESDKLKSAFLANMSHEIRTPMNGILGFAELLKRPMVNGRQQKEYLNIIEKSARRMLGIITDLVNISKIEAGQMDVKIKEGNLNNEMDFLYSFFKPETDMKNIKLSFHKNLPNDEVDIKTDLEKVTGILVNLIKNAIKFTSEGSIDIGYKKKEDFLEFFVKDTGQGVSEENKELIFERFRQGNDSLNRGYEGSGLGLSISKAYVEMLGGKMWFKSKTADSSEKHGSEFYFTIPYNPLSKKDVKEKNRMVSKNGTKKNKKFNILVVEDDEVSMLLLKNILEPISNKFRHAPTGKKALEIIKKNSDIDFILMDIRMPVMNGYDATRKIRKFNKDVLIIAQTAFAMEGDREKALKAGCNDYITKPIQLEKFKVILEKFNLE